MTKVFTGLAAVLTLVSVALPALADDQAAPAPKEKKGVVKTVEQDAEKVGSGVVKGAEATVHGVEKVGKGIGHGTLKGVEAIGAGAKKGAVATVHGVEKVGKGIGHGLEKVGSGAKSGLEKLTGHGKKAAAPAAADPASK